MEEKIWEYPKNLIIVKNTTREKFLGSQNNYEKIIPLVKKYAGKKILNLRKRVWKSENLVIKKSLFRKKDQ